MGHTLVDAGAGPWQNFVGHLKIFSWKNFVQPTGGAGHFPVCWQDFLSGVPNAGYLPMFFRRIIQAGILPGARQRLVVFKFLFLHARQLSVCSIEFLNVTGVNAAADGGAGQSPVRWKDFWLLPTSAPHLQEVQLMTPMRRAGLCPALIKARRTRRVVTVTKSGSSIYA